MNLSKDYQLWKSSFVFQDLKAYIDEVLELNRDILEGLKLSESESEDFIRGRSRMLRDLLFYIDEMCKEETD
jgi:hypothetical protein